MHPITSAAKKATYWFGNSILECLDVRLIHVCVVFHIRKEDVDFDRLGR